MACMQAHTRLTTHSYTCRRAHRRPRTNAAARKEDTPAYTPRASGRCPSVMPTLLLCKVLLPRGLTMSTATALPTPSHPPIHHHSLCTDVAAVWPGEERRAQGQGTDGMPASPQTEALKKSKELWPRSKEDRQGPLLLSFMLCPARKLARGWETCPRNPPSPTRSRERGRTE